MGIGGRAVGRWRLIGDVPFEFESEVARASAVAEASHVESSAAAARHDVKLQREMLMQSGGGRSRAAVEMEVVEREQSNRRKRKEPRLVRVARDSRRHFDRVESRLQHSNSSALDTPHEGASEIGPPL